jgi:hypothetical protein
MTYRVSRDPFDAYRRSALEGLSAPVLAPASWRKPPRPRSPAGAPSLPEGAERLSREPLVGVLREEAAQWWRRAVPAWSPGLEAVVARGVESVALAPGLVTVQLGHATYRARGVPTPWVPVVVAMLLDAELVPVRRAMRRGVRQFRPGDVL